MNLTEKDKQEILNYLKANKPLPDKYRFSLFGDERELELVWNGKSGNITNVVLPFQILENIDEPREEDERSIQTDLFDVSGRQQKGWTNKLIWGDNKYILSSIINGPMRQEIEEQGGLKLVYIDPPFNVGDDFNFPLRILDNVYEKKRNALEEIAYRDTWGKGSDSFLAMIYERIKLIHNLLAEDGTLYIHSDLRVNSILRIILDEIFGEKNFRNEIIWCYTSASNLKKDFAKKHDTILRYSKSDNYTFNPDDIRVEYDPKTIENYKKGLGGSGFRSKENQKEDVQLSDGKIPEDWWQIAIAARHPKDGINRTGYPTEKPSKLLERIIKASSNENDLVADFFCGSGTTLSIAEKLNRKWLGCDLGKFAIHTVRKRLINIQRELKSSGKNYRAFEVLNLGKYERQYYVKIFSENQKISEKLKLVKIEEYKKLIAQAYNAELINSYKNFDAKKGSVLIFIGPVDFPVTRNDIERIIDEALENKITQIEVLAFEYEMGLFPAIQEEAKNKGIRLDLKIIPDDVFDKRAVEKGNIKFYDVSYIDAKITPKDNTVSVELVEYTPNYHFEDLKDVSVNLREGKKELIVQEGNIFEVVKKKEIIKKTPLIKHWSDWVDYWSVDFDYESKKEFIRIKKNDKWIAQATGSFIFENEWQSFRTKENNKLEIKTPFHPCTKKQLKIAIKVIDIFANDTMIIKSVNL